jgi:carbonic anhydrase/acetyltransferase-like protein (isoleucine patch superfamily)
VLALGSPAKVVRALTPEEIAGLLKSADGYVERARLFRERLTLQV